MAYLNDRVLDNGLTVLDTEADRLYLCTSALSLANATPPSYADATSTYAKGNKTGISIGAPADGASNGRRVTVGAITGGSISADGTVHSWALVDSANSRVLAAGTLAADQAVTNGNTFSLAAFDITLPDPA